MSEPLNVAIVGCGIGHMHAQAYRALPEQFRLVAVCDIDLPRARQFAALYDIPRMVDDLAELCAITLSSMNLWIQMFQFHAGIGGGETPVYSDGFLVPLLHPCLDLPMQGGLVWNPAIQAASHQGTQFNLGHIQPTAVLGRVVVTAVE